MEIKTHTLFISQVALVQASLAQVAVNQVLQVVVRQAHLAVVKRVLPAAAQVEPVQVAVKVVQAVLRVGVVLAVVVPVPAVAQVAALQVIRLTQHQ